MASADYLDENTYAAPPKLFGSLVVSETHFKESRKEHLSRLLGLFMVGRWEKTASKFKEIEEAKWEVEAKKKKAKRDASSGESKFGTENIEQEHGLSKLSQEERQKRVIAALEKLKEGETASILRDDFAEEIVKLAENDVETHSRVGLVGLSNPYFAEDFGVFQHKKQLYDGVFGAGEEAGAVIQARAKVRGMLEAHGLLPPAQSGLWSTTDAALWDRWAAEGVDAAPEQPNGWQELSFEEVAKVVSGVVAEGWAPGAQSKEKSEEEWQRRLKLTREVQSTRRVNRDALGIEWVSRTYLEPNWTADDARRRWRERKVVLKVSLKSLRLPHLVRDRLVQVLGKRYDSETDTARVVADKYDSKEENRLYSLLLFRSLLSDAFQAHPSFVRVNETKEGLTKALSQDVVQTLKKKSEEPVNVIFRLRHQ